MNQYYIIEIQQNMNSEYGHIVHWAFDENATKARLKAEAKYHEVLAAAANAVVDTLLSNSATLLASDGRVIMYQCYKHTAGTETPAEEESEEPVEG